MRTELPRFNGAVVRDPAIVSWIKEHVGGLGTIARRWFAGSLPAASAYVGGHRGTLSSSVGGDAAWAPRS